jgi:Uma2 family endonuclease
MPNLKKAELIEGIVYMPSPVRLRQHSLPNVQVITWLGHYVAKTPGLSDFGDNCTLRLDDENEPQPDALLRLPERAGGRSRVSDDDYVEGAVEFVAEIAASSVSLDMHAKLRTYQAHGIQEYLVYRVYDAAVDWFALREGKYDPIVPDDRGIVRSKVFPGLWLDPAALIRGDLARLLAVLDEATTTPEHAAFVDRLRTARTA